MSIIPPQEIVSYLKLDGLVDKLESENDFVARIKITLQALKETLPMDVQCEHKDNGEALKLRKQADKLVVKQKGKFQTLLKAREIYSKSISKAKESSVELAQAYANRSSVLFHLKFHNECVRDIDRALELTSYPDHLRPNLTRRKAKCLKLLGNPESEKFCEEARILLQNLNIKDETKEQLEIRIDGIADTISLHETELKETEPKKDCSFRFLPNKSIPSASEAVHIEYTKELGKHLVADRDIDVGEVVIVEKPYASYLSSKSLYTHCSHCFVRAWDSIPCEHCVSAMYCSENCKNEAWKQYHDIECPIRGILEASSIQDIGLFGLKLAILTVRESGSLKNLKKELKQINQCDDHIKKCLSDDGIYCSDNYKALYNLNGHESSRNKPEIFTISLNTSFILYYVFTLTSFFGDNPDATVSTICENKNAMFMGKLIAHCMAVVQINDHEFCECRDGNYEGVGSVIGSVASLLNHSCDPNVSRCCVMKDKVMQQVFHTVRPIKQGSPILDDYGCHFALSTKTKREEFLKKYYFKCTCPACDEVWPLFDDLPPVLSVVTEKEPRLAVARALVRSKEFKRLLAKGGVDKYEGNKTEILVTVAKSINTFSQFVDAPCKEYYELIELFKQAFYAIFGYNFEVHDPMCVCC